MMISYFQQSRFPKDGENIRRWTIKQFVQALEEAQGVLTIMLPPSAPILQVMESLHEYEKSASEIETEAIVCAREMLTNRMKKKLPDNGTAIYIGIENKIRVKFGPFRRIETYLCTIDKSFCPKIFTELLEPLEKYGFVIVQDNQAVFGILGSYRCEVLDKFVYSLRDRGSLFSKVCETSKKHYINSATEKPNIVSLIIGGDEGLIEELAESLDDTLQKIIVEKVKTVDGGETGFNEAIEKSKRKLPPGLKIMRHKRALQTFFGLLQTDSKRCVFGVDKTLEALLKYGHGAVTMLIVCEDLKVQVRLMKNKKTGKHVIKEWKEGDNTDDTSEWNIVKDKILLLEWLANEYESYAWQLEIVSNQTREGHQFWRAGFGGIAGTIMIKEKDDSIKKEETDELEINEDDSETGEDDEDW